MKKHTMAYLSLIIVFVSSTIFGLWFKFKQLSIASEKLIHYYPFTGYAAVIIQFFLIFCVLWLGLTLISSTIDKKKSIENNLFIHSLPFTVFWLPFFNIPLLFLVCSFLAFSLAIIVLKIRQNEAFCHKVKEPLVVLIIFIGIYLIIFKSLSPLYHKSFLDAWGRNDFFLNFEHQWENAKAFDFIGNFKQKGALGGYSQGVYAVSELSSLIVLLFDIPLVDLLSKYNSIKFMFFSLYIFASYGCFLFLRYGLRMSLIPCFIGGLGYIFANPAFLSLLGAEYSIHQINFIYFPWVLLFIKRAYSQNNPLLLCLAGTIASLTEYTISNQPESHFIYILFCNSYNIYLAVARFRNNHFAPKAIPQFLSNILIFPFFHVIGLAFRLIPLCDSLMSREFAIYDSAENHGGFGWGGTFKNYSTIFFRFNESVLNADGGFLWHDLIVPAYLITGRAVLLYTGQFVMLMIFAFIYCSLIRCSRGLFKNPIAYLQSLQLKDPFFFLLMFLILALNMPLGNHSFVGYMMKLTGCVRIHSQARLFMYYFFFALITAMYGLNYLLKFKKIRIINVAFAIYLLTLLIVYFYPGLTPAKPEIIYFDATILFVMYFILSLLFQYHSALLKNTSKAMLIIIAAFSFLSLYGACYQKTFNTYVTEINNNNSIYRRIENVFTSFCTAVTYLRNNQHDTASIHYLEQRINKFKEDIYKEYSNYSQIVSYFKIDSSSPEEYYKKINAILENNTDQQQFFETIAPEIDNFYWNNNKYQVPIREQMAYYAPLPIDVNNIVQFYLPDRYNLITVLSPVNTAKILPVGKNSELLAGYMYGAAHGYPSIDINFHLNSLYPDSFIDANRNDTVFKNFSLSLNLFSSNKRAKKLCNIYGIDYLLCQKLDLASVLDVPKVDPIESIGFVPYNLPESYLFSARFPFWQEHFMFEVFQNPSSYGKAYIAKWVQVITPNDNLVNTENIGYSDKWPSAKILYDNFNNLISKIPDDIWRASLVESASPTDYSNSPYVYTANNQVNIIKIIGSKAIFDVDCQEDNCWFVYNTAALKGWKAYSYSKPLQIHKANLGFIGIKLDKGKHFLWFEYRPFSNTIGFFITFLSGILVFSLLIFKLFRSNQGGIGGGRITS